MLSLAYLDSGKTTEALALLEQLRAAYQRLYGPEDDRTVICTNNLGSAYLAVGKMSEAVKLFEQVQDICLKTNGPEYETTLRAQYNLAVAYHKSAQLTLLNTGNADQATLQRAIELFRKVHDVQTRTLGPEHPATLETLAGVALTLIDANQVESAIELDERILSVTRKVHGEFHPLTFIARNTLAEAYIVGGAKKPDMLKEAVSRLENLQDLSLRELDPDSILVSKIKYNLAAAYLDAAAFSEEGSDSQLKQAIDLLVSVRDAYVRQLSIEHPDTLQAINLLAFAYYKNGQLTEAAEQFDRVLKYASKMTGPNYPDPILTAHNVATILKKQGQKQRSVELHLEVAKYLEQNDFKHHDALDLMIGLCNDFEELGLFAEAEPWRRHVVVALVQKEGEGTESKQYTREASFLSRNLLKQKKWSDAAIVLSKLYPIRQKNEGGTPGCFNTQSMYGGALLGEKKYKEAESLLVEGYQGLKAKADVIPRDSQFIIAEAGQRLLQYYLETKQDAKAEKIRKELKSYNVSS